MPGGIWTTLLQENHHWALQENRFNKLRMLGVPQNLVGMSQIEAFL